MTSLFPQSEQIINTDRFYAGSIRLLLLVCLFVAVGLWLLFGSLTFYATSEQAVTTRDNLIQATFTSEELEGIRVEQTATVLFATADEDPQTTSALIVRITQNVNDTHAQLDLLVTEREPFIEIFGEDAQVQQVRVVREMISPLSFIFDSAGLTE